jgi:hypothetical protein
MIRQWFEMPMNHGFQNIVNWPNGDYNIRTFYERLVRPIIYPDYDFNTFQTAKASNSIYAEMDTWFFTNFKDTKLFQVWESGINFLIDNLDDRYLVQAQEGKMLDLKQYMSPMYYLGESTIPPVGVVQNGQVLKQARNDQSRYIHCIEGKLSIY